MPDLLAELGTGAPTVSNSADLQRAPRIQRDMRTLPVDAARGRVTPEAPAYTALARLHGLRK